MSQDFKFKYDQMKAGNPAGDENTSHDGEDRYVRESNVRNVCFILPDKKQIALSYSYLVSQEYLPEENAITLFFTSHTIILTGIHLQGLFDEFLQQMPKYIMSADERYNAIEENEKPIVNKISVSKNGE